MPFEEVGVERGGGVVGGRRGGEFGGFAEDASDCGGFGVECLGGGHFAGCAADCLLLICVVVLEWVGWSESCSAVSAAAAT